MCSRCPWAETSLMMQEYHDKEWGIVHTDDTYLFEMLTLEGAQAGLSWQIILNKRQAYRDAFHHFDVAVCARLTDQEIEEIRLNHSVVKHKLKLYSVRSNAQSFQNIQREFGSFSTYIWSFSPPIKNNWQSPTEVPSQTALSSIISKDLKQRGFKFIGPTIVYSFMQAIGMVNDHLLTCDFRNHILSTERKNK